MFHIIGFIITGLIVGLLARALKPGNDSMSIAKTTILGMIGALAAGWVGHAVGWYEEGQGAGLIVSTLGAIVVLSIYYAMVGRQSRIGHL